MASVAAFTGSGPDADALAERMMDAWLAFARTGDPSTPVAPVAQPRPRRPADDGVRRHDRGAARAALTTSGPRSTRPVRRRLTSAEPPLDQR